MWFNSKDITIKKKIIVNDLHGYVLPHAGTKFIGEITSHTLRFRPSKPFSKIIIIYYPSSKIPDINIDNKNYYHEYYVPWKSLEKVFGINIIYEGYNVADNAHLMNQKLPIINNENILIVVSADFSHFLPLHNAMNLENKAAHELMFRNITNTNTNTNISVIDDVKSFQVLYNSIPQSWLLQWIGRSRSSGDKAVGYLTFLLREKPNYIQSIQSIQSIQPNIDGIFVTIFSKNMNAREWLGEWFNKNKKWSQQIETNLINKVIELGKTSSRLTGGAELDIPLTNYTVTYLYKENPNQTFIRGWHSILHNAFYLPEVFLENTYENGTWIKSSDTKWNSNNNNKFNLNETLQKLDIKAGITHTLPKSKRKSKSKNKHTIIKHRLITKRTKYSDNNTNTNTNTNTTTNTILFTSKVSHFSLL